MLNSTDRMLPWVVCWDEQIDPPRDIARNQARFDSEGEARGFFKNKCGAPRQYVWLGVFGSENEVHGAVEDLFYLDWSFRGDRSAPPTGKGVPHRLWKPGTEPPTPVVFKMQVPLSNAV